MTNLYVKFSAHPSYVTFNYNVKSGGQTDTPGDNKRHLPKFWQRPKK